jgi:hypothetical protein
MTSTGGCLCGSLRYAVEGQPTAVGKCYCLDCRRETGGGHVTFATFPVEAITFAGDRKAYAKTGDSGAEVVRVFCPSCGTTVAGYPKMQGEIGAVRLGTLDDASGLSPSFVVYGSRAPDWDKPPAGLKVFATLPQH